LYNCCNNTYCCILLLYSIIIKNCKKKIFLTPSKILIIALLTKLNNLLNLIINKLNLIINKLTKNNKLTINSIIHNDTGRFYQYLLTNNNLLSHKEVLHGIYNTLMSDETFKNFGTYKVIIVSAMIDGEEFNYHHNVLITNNTSFEQYYNEVKDILSSHFVDGYQIDTVQSFKILVWNIDLLANKKY
jgi:hypothetical protein